MFSAEQRHCMINQGPRRLRMIHSHRDIPCTLLQCHSQGRSQEFANGWTSRRPGGRNSPAGSSGRASVGVWRRSPQKLETNMHVDFESKQNTGEFCTILVCYRQSVDEQNIFGRRRETCTYTPPSGYTPGQSILWIRCT